MSVIGFHHDAENEFQRHLNKVEALACRIRGTGKLSPGASIYRESKLATYQALAGAAGVGDFPKLLGDTLERLALETFNTQQPAHRLLSRAASFRDFRVSSAGIVGDLALLPLGEREEVRSGFIADSGETVLKFTRGRVYRLSRHVVANDDVGLIGSLAEQAATAAVAAREADFFGLLLSNSGAGPVLEDGDTFFDSGRGNVLAPAALSATSLGDAIAALRAQRSPAGHPLSLAPRFLLAPPALEATGRTLARDLAAPDAPPLGVVVSGYLTSGFYVFSDPNQRPAIVAGSVGRRPFTVESAQPFEMDGFAFRVLSDYGIGPVDPRAAVHVPAL